MTTAEWECTACGATNRRLVRDTETRADDRCYTCRTRHVLEAAERPTRWKASRTA